MKYFAKIDHDLVVDVIVCDEQTIDIFREKDRDVYYYVETFKDGQLRGHYASFGYQYDTELDVFYKPQPYPSWNLNTSTYIWEPPVPYPDEGCSSCEYEWNEEIKEWQKTFEA
jgi:hypothetical protein